MGNVLETVTLGKRMAARARVTPEDIAKLAEVTPVELPKDIANAAYVDNLVYNAKKAQADPADAGLFPPGLVLDLALQTAPAADILAAYGLTVEDFRVIIKNPNFVAEYKAIRDQMKEEGFSFRLKARAQAESLLSTSWKMIHDPNTPPGVRKDLIVQTVKWANLEPKEGEPQRQAVSIQINLGDQGQKAVTISGDVVEPV